MNMIFENAISLGPPSVDGGRGRLALGLVDEFAGDVLVLLVEPRRQILAVDIVELAAVAGRRLGRPVDAGHEVAEDLFGDEQGVLELDDGLGRGLEEDDVVRALTMPVDWVGQATAPPRGDFHDLATGRDDAASGPIDE